MSESPVRWSDQQFHLIRRGASRRASDATLGGKRSVGTGDVVGASRGGTTRASTGTSGRMPSGRQGPCHSLSLIFPLNHHSHGSDLGAKWERGSDPLAPPLTGRGRAGRAGGGARPGGAVRRRLGGECL